MQRLKLFVVSLLALCLLAGGLACRPTARSGEDKRVVEPDGSVPTVPQAAPSVSAKATPDAAGAVGIIPRLSGRYGELLLGFDPKTRVLTGYFASGTGVDEQTKQPRFTCTFYLRGNLLGETANIATWLPGASSADAAPEVIRGTLVAQQTTRGATISVSLKSEHPGCWNVQHFADAQPAVFTVGEVGDWIAVRIVAPERAHFYAGPGARSSERAYAIRGDAVVVTDGAPGWVHARVGRTEGWLRESDLYRDSPPDGGP
jgi:hypothetical protein